jgi:hypothetical protein
MGLFPASPLFRIAVLRELLAMETEAGIIRIQTQEKAI